MENKILIGLLNDLIGLAYETMELVDQFIFNYDESNREENELLEGEALDHFRLVINDCNHEDIELRFNSFVRFRNCTEQIEEMIRTNNFENLYDVITKFDEIEYNLNDQLYNEAYNCGEEEDMVAAESRNERIEYIINKVCDILNSSFNKDDKIVKLSVEIPTELNAYLTKYINEEKLNINDILVEKLSKMLYEEDKRRERYELPLLGYKHYIDELGLDYKHHIDEFDINLYKQTN